MKNLGGQRRGALAAAAWVALALAATSARSANYSMEFVQRAGAYSTSINDINNAGTAVGTAWLDLGTSQVSRGFVYAGGVLTDFSGPQRALNSELNGITDAGVLVGSYTETLEGPARVFSYRGGTYRTFSVAADVSMNALGVSPNGRWIVGGLTDSQGQRGFIIDTLPGGTMSTLDCAADFCVAAGVNNAGTVVGYDRTASTSSSGGYVGAGWQYELSTGFRSDYSVAGAERVALRDINAFGMLSGYFGDARFDIAHGLVASASAFQTIDVPAGEPTFLVAANDGGTLAGYYESGPFRDSVGFIARPVPEPATALLMALGIAGLACAARVRRSHHQMV